MRLDAKVDSTQADIVDCLRCHGFSVISLARLGSGVPDILFARGGILYMAEIKNGQLGWKFTCSQRKFHSTWNSPILIFDSVNAVEQWIKSIFKNKLGESKQ